MENSQNTRSAPLKGHDFLPGIHAFRGLAAMLVVCLHSAILLHKKFPALDTDSRFLGHWFRAGGCGVQFFFVLSGYIIHYMHGRDEKGREACLRFLKKRFVRVFPVYWVVLFAVTIGLLAFPAWMPQISRNVGAFFANLFLIPRAEGMAVSVAWTLSHEILFYLSYGILFYWFRSWWLVYGLWSIFAIVYGIGWHMNLGDGELMWMHFLFDINNVLFVIGMAVSWLSSRFPKDRSVILKIGGGMFFVLYGVRNSLGLARDFEGIGFWLDQLIFGLVFGVLIFGAVSLRRGSFFCGKLFKILGDSSYSIYLVHFFFQVVSLVFMSSLNMIERFPNIFYLCLVVGAAAGGILFHKVIELPLLAKSRGFLSRRNVSQDA